MAWRTGAAIAFMSTDNAQAVIKRFRGALDPRLQMFTCEVGPDCSGYQIPSLPSTFSQIRWLQDFTSTADESQ